MKRQYSKFLATFLAVVMLLAVAPFAPAVLAADADITVDWSKEYQTMEGVGGAYAFNKANAMLQISEFDPDTIEHLVELIYDAKNGVAQNLVRVIMGDGGVRSNGTAARPGYNPINGLRADASKPGYDVEGNKIPMSTRIYSNATAALNDAGTSTNPGSGVTLADPSNYGFTTSGTALYGTYGYTMNDWGNNHYDGASDTVWPNEGKYDADGKLVSGYGFAWDLPGWNEPIPGDTGGFTNNYIGKGQVEIVDRPRTMKELFDVGQVWIMNQAKAYGVDTFYSCAWTPPYWMKTNMSIFGQDQSSADYLRAEVDENGRKIYFQAYADYIAAYVYGYWTEFGIPITHVGPYNESESTHGYSGFRARNAAEVATLVNDYILPTLAEKFGADGLYAGALSPDGKPLDWMPELVIGDGTNLGASFGSNFTGPYFTNSANYGKVTASTHFYGTVSTNGNARTMTGSPGATPMTAGSTSNYPTALRNYSIWQTEFMNQDSGSSESSRFTQRHYYQQIDDAIRYNYMITNTFTSDPGFNAYIWWWTAGHNGANGSDLIRFQTTGSPQAAGGSTLTGAYHTFKRFYTFGHLSRFINTGSVRIDATTMLSSYLNSVAYKTPDGKDFSVTFTNADYVDKTIDVALSNFDGYKGNLSSVTVFRTSDSENMKKVGVIPVVDGKITLSIPAQSVVTIVPSDGTYATYNGLNGERDLYSTMEAADNDGVIGTPADATGKNGFPSVTMQNGDALVYKNVNFADGSANGGIVRRHLLYILANIESAPAGGVIRAYVAEPGTVITDPAKQATFVGEILVPKDTDSARLANQTSYQATGTRSTRIDTGDLGAYMYKDLYLVALGVNGADLFTVSRFRFDVDDGGNAAGSLTTNNTKPAAVGVLQNGDFENGSTGGATTNWSVSGTGTLAAVTEQTYSGLNINLHSTAAQSAKLSGRSSGAGVQQDLTGRIMAGEIYTFRGMFMPTSDGATAKAELVYMNGSEEIGRETIAERSGLDLLPERESGVRPKQPGTTDLNMPIAGIPMNMTAVTPTKFRPSGWYEVTGTFTYNPPEGTTAVWLALSDDKASDLYIDEVTLVSAPDRAALIEALNTYGAVADSALVAEVLAAITNASLTQATVLSLIARLTPSITLGASTIVSGLSAWISVSTSIAEGTAYLEVGGVALYSADVVDGVARLFIEKAPAPGTYRVVVSGAVDIAGEVTVVPYNKDIWKPVITENGDGKAVIVFADAIGAATAGYAATLNGEAVAVTQVGKTLVTEADYADLKAGDKFVITGVMYPILFPSYSFTFTVAVK